MNFREAFSLLMAVRECLARLEGPQPARWCFFMARTSRLLGAEIEIAQAVMNQGIDVFHLKAYDDAVLQLVWPKVMTQSPNTFRGSAANEMHSLLTAEQVEELETTFPGMREKSAQRRARGLELDETPFPAELAKLPLAEWPAIPTHLSEGLLPLVDDGTA